MGDDMWTLLNECTDDLVIEITDLRRVNSRLGDQVQRLTNLLIARDTEVVALREAVDDARRFAGVVEAQNAAALALHTPIERPSADAGFCNECSHPWPCSTARVLGVTP